MCSVSTNSSMLAQNVTSQLALHRVNFGCVVNALSGGVVHTELCKPLDERQTGCVLLQTVSTALVLYSLQ